MPAMPEMRPLLLLPAALLVASCGPDDGFGAFTLVDKLRVLAVQAEPAALRPGETARLTSLVVAPRLDRAEYRWSWCPLSAGRDRGFDCVVDEAPLRERLEALSPGAGEGLPAFDLGASRTADLAHSLDPTLLQGLCRALISFEAPAFADLPTCEGALEVTVRLEVTAGDERETVVKQLPLAFAADAATNANPTLGAVRVAPEFGGEPSELPEDGSAELAWSKGYRLTVDVPESAPEPLPTGDREVLFMTWFTTAGSVRDARTSFLEGVADLDALGENVWTAPDADAPPELDPELLLVLQDERGGVTWARRRFALGEK